MRNLLFICCFFWFVACTNKQEQNTPIEPNKFEEVLAQLYLLEGINNRNFNVNDPSEIVKNTNADSLLSLNNISKEDFVTTYMFFAEQDKPGLIKMYDRILVRLSLYEEKIHNYDNQKLINPFDSTATWYLVDTVQSPTSPDSLEIPQ